ncbi:MAG: calcium-binding protein, partial [Bacteriovoracaceae bacterium]
GDDLLSGGQGNDLLYGGDGNDTLEGGSGTDKLYGGDGNDTFIAEGKDQYYGGSGEDTIQTDSDLTIDQSFGRGNSIEKIVGDGDSEVRGDNSNNTIDLRNTELEGIAEVDGGKGDDRLYGNDDGNNLDGNKGNDRLYGEAGDDLLSGGQGNDLLYGGEGDDYILGGSGDDQIYAGSGNDYVSGGSGTDTLNFSGRLRDYEFLKSGDNLVIQDSVAGRDGQVVIEDIDNLKFRDGTQSFDDIFSDAQDIGAGEDALALDSFEVQESSWDEIIESASSNESTSDLWEAFSEASSDEQDIEFETDSTENIADDINNSDLGGDDIIS